MTVETHTPEAHDVIAAELTACVLGHRDNRPELRMDLIGEVARLSRTALLRLRDAGGIFHNRA